MKPAAIGIVAPPEVLRRNAAFLHCIFFLTSSLGELEFRVFCHREDELELPDTAESNAGVGVLVKDN